LFHLPEDAPVLAHWHGSNRTDGFAMTVGMLKGVGAELNTYRQTSNKYGRQTR
jgi:hypothetical protein